MGVEKVHTLVKIMQVKEMLLISHFSNMKYVIIFQAEVQESDLSSLFSTGNGVKLTQSGDSDDVRIDFTAPTFFAGISFHWA